MSSSVLSMVNKVMTSKNPMDDLEDGKVYTGHLIKMDEDKKDGRLSEALVLTFEIHLSRNRVCPLEKKFWVVGKDGKTDGKNISVIQLKEVIKKTGWDGTALGIGKMMDKLLYLQVVWRTNKNGYPASWDINRIEVQSFEGKNGVALSGRVGGRKNKTKKSTAEDMQTAASDEEDEDDITVKQEDNEGKDLGFPHGTPPPPSDDQPEYNLPLPPSPFQGHQIFQPVPPAPVAAPIPRSASTKAPSHPKSGRKA